MASDDDSQDVIWCEGCTELGAEVSRSRESRAMKGKTMSVIKHTAGTGAIATAVAAAVVAGLGLPLLGAALFLAVLLIGVVCWVIKDDKRSERVNKLMFAIRGDVAALAQPAPKAVPPARRRKPRRRAQ